MHAGARAFHAHGLGGRPLDERGCLGVGLCQHWLFHSRMRRGVVALLVGVALLATVRQALLDRRSLLGREVVVRVAVDIHSVRGMVGRQRSECEGRKHQRRNRLHCGCVGLQVVVVRVEVMWRCRLQLENELTSSNYRDRLTEMRCVAVVNESVVGLSGSLGGCVWAKVILP